MVEDDLTLTSNFNIDLARLPLCFSNLLPHIYRVYNRLVFDKRADESFIEARNPYDGKQGWFKNQNNLLEPICSGWLKNKFGSSKVGAKTKIIFRNRLASRTHSSLRFGRHRT